MRTLALAALALLLAPAPAQACGGSGAAFLRKVLPGWAPADAIVAEIEFDAALFELRPNFDSPLRARIRRMIQGDYAGATLFVRVDPMPCGSPFGHSMSGFLVGTPDGMEDGVLVVVPMFPLFELRTVPLQLPGR
jgi:hypothetical protein